MTPFLITLLAPRAPPATEGGEKREPITELMTDLCYPIHPWDVSDESGSTVRDHANFRPEGTHFSRIRSLEAVRGPIQP